MIFRLVSLSWIIYSSKVYAKRLRKMETELYIYKYGLSLFEEIANKERGEDLNYNLISLDLIESDPSTRRKTKKENRKWALSAPIRERILR